ncbi:MAG: homoserine kinase [Flavobacteriaceae bacterium]|nr:MAG: homoserine kinase [Flavobacteriaceae bacterium]
MNEIKLFTPATVANVSCGFDVLGLCLDTVGDEMIIRKTVDKRVRITSVTGQENIPTNVRKNVAGIAALALLKESNTSFGFEIEIHKKIKPGSGIGSSAASAAGAVFGINKFLEQSFNTTDLVRFAMEGERLASGTAHADNVAPALFGGFTLVRGYDPLEVIKIPPPEHLFVTVIHPQIEIKTSAARAVLKPQVSLKKTVIQMGNFGGLIAGLYTQNYDLIGRSLHDEIAEPFRSVLIPSFDLLKTEVLKAGALGVGISGSGPSVFALSKGWETAYKVATSMEKVYKNTGIGFEIHISKINQQGIKILQTK